MTDVLFGALVAVLLFLVGLWGRRNVADLVPRSLSPYRREERESDFRRGAFALMGLAVLIMLGVLARIVFTVFG